MFILLNKKIPFWSLEFARLLFSAKNILKFVNTYVSLLIVIYVIIIDVMIICSYVSTSNTPISSVVTSSLLLVINCNFFFLIARVDVCKERTKCYLLQQL